jgi:hypothetical protein
MALARPQGLLETGQRAGPGPAPDMPALVGQPTCRHEAPTGPGACGGPRAAVPGNPALACLDMLRGYPPHPTGGEQLSAGG